MARPQFGGLQLTQALLVQGKSLEDRVAAAGGVDSKLVEGFRSILQDSSLDGAFAAAAITLPASSEVIDLLPGADPVRLFNVRWAVCWSLRLHLPFTGWS